MAVDDEIWRPGYDGPPPVSGETSFDRGVAASREERVSVRRRLAVAMIAAGSTAVATVVVIGSLSDPVDPKGSVATLLALEVVDDDRVQFSSATGVRIGEGGPLQLLDEPSVPFAGDDVHRLPADLVERWVTELPPLVADGGDNATTWIEAADARYVIVGAGDARSLTGPAAVHVLDAATGERLWAKQVGSRIDQVEFIAVIGDALVVTVGDEVVSLDVRDGLELWSQRRATLDGSIEQIRRLEGTDLLARTSVGVDDMIRLVDPSTGAVVGELNGEVLGTDRRGQWRLLRGGKILEFDLITPPNGESGPLVDGKLLATIDPERSREAAIVADSLVATLGASLAIAPLVVDGERATAADGLTPLTIDLGTPGWLVLVSDIVPLGGSAFAIAGGGTVSGAEVVDGRVRFGWQRRGFITATFATERGMVLLVGSDGGSSQTLVDGATGQTIAALNTSPGLFHSLQVVENGAVTLRTSIDGARIAGLDLDGNELWALDGSAPASVGDGVVVRSIPQPDGSFEVTAYGDPGEDREPAS